MHRSLIILLLLYATGIAAEQGTGGQAPMPPPAQAEAMQKLVGWVGDWRGSGWMTTRGGQREEFMIHENVQPRVGGSILLIEGRGTRKSEAGAGDVVVHEALAVLSYDPKTQRYRWRAHDLRGQAIDAEAQLIDGGLQWGYRNEPGGVSVRFTIRIDGKRWHEVGEVTRDGKTWQKFLEMNLVRQK
jgi:hypothetical protein